MAESANYDDDDEEEACLSLNSYHQFNAFRAILTSVMIVGVPAAIVPMPAISAAGMSTY
jgi:hypothetical protein